MKKLIPIAVLCAALLATPALAGTNANPPARRAGISSTETANLHALDAGDLGALRAGVSAGEKSVQPAERTALAAASARDNDLGALRGGDITLSDHDIQIIAIVAVVVILIIIIV